MIPVRYDDWDGPAQCSFCGLFATSITRDDNLRTVSVYFDPDALIDKGRPTRKIEPLAPQGGKRKYTVGGTCRKGHLLTEQTLYISPLGAASCKVCRRKK